MTAGLVLLALAAVTVSWTQVWVRISPRSVYDNIVFLLCVALTAFMVYVSWKVLAP